MTIEPIVAETREKMTHRNKKLSSAASNVAQAKAKSAQSQAVGFIARPIAEHGVNSKTSAPMLTAIFPQKGQGLGNRVDLSFLLSFPNLQAFFTEAFLVWGANCAPNTRLTLSSTLNCYFFGYLDTEWFRALRPEDIDDELLAGFKESLLSKPGAHGQALSARTVGQAIGALRSIMNTLDTGQWASVARYIKERIPAGPVGAGRKSIPTQVLMTEHIVSILQAAEVEVLAIEQRFNARRGLLADGYMQLFDTARIKRNTRRDYRDLSICLAALDAAYPRTIPDLKIIRAEHADLGNAIQYIHGCSAVSSYLNPSTRDLVPFVLLLTVATVFNPDTVLSLCWADISFDKEQAGADAIEIVGAKGRAIRDLVRLLDPEAAVSSRLSLKRMLSCLREMTLRIRPDVATEHADRLFVFVQEVGVKKPKGFGLNGQRTQTPSSDQAWKHALMEFIIDNNLTRFTLGQLRPTILDLVQFMDGSLEAARRVGNHGSPATTWTHYTSGGVRKRYRERIGQVILLRERWLESCGAIDPRRLVSGQDKGAATPGFSCLNPFDSQRPNQQAGRLCKDYGGCPSCPMAAAHPHDSLCVAFYTALEVAIYRSQPGMSARTWIERWTPILADLRALQACIPLDVLVASRAISIELPNVG